MRHDVPDLVISASPFVKRPVDTPAVMRHVLYALAPALLAASNTVIASTSTCQAGTACPGVTTRVTTETRAMTTPIRNLNRLDSCLSIIDQPMGCVKAASVESVGIFVYP